MICNVIMKLEKKIQAIALRKNGLSFKQIAQQINVSLGSVSYWLRDIVLSDAARRKLDQRKILGYERQRVARLNNSKQKLENLYVKCNEELGGVSDRDLFVAGIMLYAGEGTKNRPPRSQRVEFTNADFRLVTIFIRFLMKCCNTPKEAIHLRLFLNKDMDEYATKQIWSDLSGIPLRQFSRVQFKPNLNGRYGKKAIYGTMHVEVYNKRLFQQITGWIKAFHNVITGCGSSG